jgi:transposase InsO family protein
MPWCAATWIDFNGREPPPLGRTAGIPLCRALTDRGTEYCGQPDRHGYELYLAVQDIDHTRTKTKHPQTNGICERFNKTVAPCPTGRR